MSLPCNANVITSTKQILNSNSNSSCNNNCTTNNNGKPVINILNQQLQLQLQQQLQQAQQQMIHQPPKPPERSCSFKDVDNLQQSIAANLEQQTSLNNQIMSNTNRRQRSLTNKDSSAFSLKDIQQSINLLNSTSNPSQQPQQQPQQVSTTSFNGNQHNRPLSRVFSNQQSMSLCGESSQAQAQIQPQQQQQPAAMVKITSMRLDEQTNICNTQHNLNKFGTMPSASKSAKLNGESKKNAHFTVENNGHDKREEEEIPEFQKVFSHLRKVKPKSETDDANSSNKINEESTNSINNNRPVFPKTLPSIPVNTTNANSVTNFDKQQNHLVKSQSSHQTNGQQPPSASDLDSDASPTKTNNDLPKFPLTNINDEINKDADSHANHIIEQYTNSRYSMNLNAKAAQTSTSNTNGTIEYASFNIKPSQYKQSGIFLPVNNNLKQHMLSIKSIREEVDLLIQRLRNLQKGRQQQQQQQQQNTSNSNASVSLEQYLKSVDEFNEKTLKQLSVISLLNNLNNEQSPNINSTEQLQEQQNKLKSLQTQIKETCACLNETLCNSNHSLSSNQDEQLSVLSRKFGEFMQNLDKFNNLLNRSSV